MSKQLFRSHNKVGETWSFQTNSPNTTFFDPTVLKNNKGRVSWDLGDNTITGYTAGNSISEVYPNSTTKTVTLRTNLLSTLTSLNLNKDHIVGHLDMSGWAGLFTYQGPGSSYFDVSDNPELTAITHTYKTTPNELGDYWVNSCDLTGTLDLRPLGDMGAIGGTSEIQIQNNPNLNRILFSGGTGGWFSLLFDENDLVDLDLSGFENFSGQFSVDDNPNMTGMTFYTGTSSIATTYFLGWVLTNYVGTLDLRGLKLSGYFDIRATSCNKVLHGFSDGVWDKYWANQCDITGNHDMTMFPTLGGQLTLWLNTNLTGVTHTASTEIFTTYNIRSCDLTGTHDMSMLTGLGTDVQLQSNSNLTDINFPITNNEFVQMRVESCDLTGELDLSTINLTNLFLAYLNSNLTSISHKAYASTATTLNNYRVHSCNLTGNHDLSMFTQLGGQFYIYNNFNLTGITHTASTVPFTRYTANSCDLRSTHDLSPLQALGGSLLLYQNGFLKDITFPYTTQSFANTGAATSQRAVGINGCSLGFVNFLPLSGATMNVGAANGCTIGLEDNNMTSGEVDNMLVNFSGLSNTYNPQGWTGVTLDISGTNAAPGTSGIAAINSLTGTPNNWTITVT